MNGGQGRLPSHQRQHDASVPLQAQKVTKECTNRQIGRPSLHVIRASVTPTTDEETCSTRDARLNVEMPTS